LGSQNIATRLGAIYSLETLALSDQSGGQTHLTDQIMETLASFVRERSQEIDKAEGDAPELAPPDIAAAFTVLVRSYPKSMRPSLDQGGVDLRRAFLRGVRLYQDMDLRCFNMSGSDLKAASLYGCDLRGVWLSGADLNGARLKEAKIDGTYFVNSSWGDAKGLTQPMIQATTAWEVDKPPHWPSNFTPPKR